MEQGTLLVKLEAAREALPVRGTVTIFQTVDGVRRQIVQFMTDLDGLTTPVTLDAPDKALSLMPDNTEQVYATYDVEVEADGYSPMLFEGVQVYSGVEAYLPVTMVPVFSAVDVSPTSVSSDTDAASADARQVLIRTTIPAPAIEGESSSGPTPRTTCSIQEPRVLSSVFIPQYITVHLGKPQNSAANETVSFPYYIKNVCSSEIYPTWAGSTKPTIARNFAGSLSGFRKIPPEFGCILPMRKSRAMDRDFCPDLCRRQHGTELG